jgi:LysR family transcriptional regulator for bpeEF and oprC
MSALTRPFEGVLPFVLIAEERSFRRAAERLGVTTAAVSKALSALERELGLRLVERTSRSMELTAEGALFLERARASLAQIEGAREAVRSARRVAAGEVVLSTSPVLVPQVLSALGALALRHPKLSARLGVSDKLARLVEEKVDVAIRLGELESSGLRSRKLCETRWVTVASPGYLAAHGTPRAVAELAQHRLLVFVGPSGRVRWPSFAGGALTAEPALVCDQGRALLDAALAGLGVAQVLDLMVDGPLREGRLVPLFEREALSGPPVHAVYVAGKGGVARVRAVLDALTAAFRG